MINLLMCVIVTLGAALAALILWLVYRRHFHRQKHDPIVYFSSWGGYGLPLHLVDRIAGSEAETREARGAERGPD